MKWSENSIILSNSAVGVILFVSFFGLEEIRETSNKLSVILFVMSYLVDLKFTREPGEPKDGYLYPDEV